MHVGFIGLGRMGKGMARRILDAGHDLTVYDVDPRATAEVSTSGACISSSVSEVCKDRDVVVTILVEDSTVAEVVLGRDGMRDSLSAEAIHLAMGTYGVAVIRKLDEAHAEAKQILIAAPVIGRPDLAAAGQLGIIAAGPPDGLRRCDPLFQVIGRRTFQAGPKPESATAIKLANNLVLGAAIVAQAEAFSLARKYGVQPEMMYEVLTDGLFAGAAAYKGYGKTMVDQSYDKAGSPVHVGLKDANLILQAADLARIPLPSLDIYRHRLLGAMAHGEGDKDQAVIAREQARSCGLE
jgi:3-hydroxyisobutyrate dehydrogenase-like beta-hydroxyacid dehydrogenase